MGESEGKKEKKGREFRREFMKKEKVCRHFLFDDKCRRGGKLAREKRKRNYFVF